MSTIRFPFLIHVNVRMGSNLTFRCKKFGDCKSLKQINFVKNYCVYLVFLTVDMATLLNSCEANVKVNKH